MAYQNDGPNVSLNYGATGLKQYIAVSVDASGRIVKPALGAPVLGILQSSGTTGLTSAQATARAGVVQVYGVSKLYAAGSTMDAGDKWATSSKGWAVPTTAGAYTCGFVIGGSSGSTGRYLTVSIQPIGTT